MKSVVLILAACALATAIPTPSKLNFRNLYKRPVGDIKTRPAPRIIGGQEAVPHSIPYQVFLEVYAADEGWYCGGSLISANFVLTAAHCGATADRAIVTLGAHRVQEAEDTQVQLISTDITINENYDADQIINDVGVIRLPQSVNFTDAIQTVALPSRDQASNDFTGVTARISGWGLTDGFGSTISPVLNYVDVEVIDNPTCEDTFGDLESSILCTSGDQLTGSCNGDSGGPLVVDGVQIGVVSFGIIFCVQSFPSGFSRVTSFQDWIADNTDVVYA